MVTAQCPDCDRMTGISGKPSLGRIITCENCGIRLEITWLDPIELDYEYDPEFDEEDEFDFYNPYGDE